MTVHRPAQTHGPDWPSGRRDGHRPLLSTGGANTVVAPGLPEVIPGQPQPGQYSAEAIAQRWEMAALLRTCRDQLATMCD